MKSAQIRSSTSSTSKLLNTPPVESAKVFVNSLLGVAHHDIIYEEKYVLSVCEIKTTIDENTATQ